MEIKNADEFWYKTQELYRNAAQNPIIDDVKRQIFLPLSEDVEQQYRKTIREKSRRNSTKRSSFSTCYITLLFAIITILAIIFVGVLIFYFCYLFLPQMNFLPSTFEFTSMTLSKPIPRMKFEITAEASNQPIATSVVADEADKVYVIRVAGLSRLAGAVGVIRVAGLSRLAGAVGVIRVAALSRLAGGGGLSRLAGGGGVSSGADVAGRVGGVGVPSLARLAGRGGVASGADVAGILGGVGVPSFARLAGRAGRNDGVRGDGGAGRNDGAGRAGGDGRAGRNDGVGRAGGDGGAGGDGRADVIRVRGLGRLFGRFVIARLAGGVGGASGVGVASGVGGDSGVGVAGEDDGDDIAGGDDKDDKDDIAGGDDVAGGVGVPGLACLAGRVGVSDVTGGVSVAGCVSITNGDSLAAGVGVNNVAGGVSVAGCVSITGGDSVTGGIGITHGQRMCSNITDESSSKAHIKENHQETNIRKYVFCIPVLICVCISMYCVKYRFYCWIFPPTVTNNLPSENQTEKIILLDPSTQHLCLHTLFGDNLIVYTSAEDCFHALTLNRSNDYIVFLPFATFKTHSLKLSRLSNILLWIFYDDNTQPKPRMSKRNYPIGFIFPDTLLENRLRLVIALSLEEQGHIYRREGLEREAEEHLLAASEQHHILRDELEQRAGIIRGREPEELRSIITTTTDDLLVRTSTLE